MVGRQDVMLRQAWEMTMTLENWSVELAQMSHVLRCAPNMVLTSWSTSAATAAQWLSFSALAPPTSATLATTTSSVSPTSLRPSSPAALLVRMEGGGEFA